MIVNVIDNALGVLVGTVDSSDVERRVAVLRYNRRGTPPMPRSGRRDNHIRHLLRRPSGGGMFSDCQMDDSATVVGE